MRENGSLPWEYFLRWGRSNRHSTGVRTEEGAVLTSWEGFDWAVAVFSWIPPDTTKDMSATGWGDVYGDSGLNSTGNSTSNNWSNRTWLLAEMSDSWKRKVTFLSLDMVTGSGEILNFWGEQRNIRVRSARPFTEMCGGIESTKFMVTTPQQECSSIYYRTHMHPPSLNFWYPGPII